MENDGPGNESGRGGAKRILRKEDTPPTSFLVSFHISGSGEVSAFSPPSFPSREIAT